MSEDCHITSASETPDRVPEGIAGTPDPAVCPGHPWKTAEEAGEFLDGMAPELDASGEQGMSEDASVLLLVIACAGFIAMMIWSLMT